MKRLFLLLLVTLLLPHCATNRRTLLPATDDQVDVSRWNRTDGCCYAEGTQVAISAGGTHSAQAGLEIATAGGNLVDVAVAVGFALAVERPQSAGLGGGGFATLHLVNEQKDQFLDFRETAPAKAKASMFLDENGAVQAGKLSQEGIFAVATPGFVAGMAEMHRKYGRLPWKSLLQPAIRLANEGFTIYPVLGQKIESSRILLSRSPYARGIFFDGKRAKSVGDKLVQKDLGRTLQEIADTGAESFYRGEIARRILAAVKEYGGLLSAADLEAYRPRWRDPLRFKWRGYQIVTAPPPSAGGIVLAETLKVWGQLLPPKGTPNEAQHLHWLAEAFKRAFAERADGVGDPDFVKVAIDDLTSDAFAEKIAKEITDKAMPSSRIRAARRPPTKQGTTGFSLIDRRGNAISLTMTINTRFGSHVLVPETGIFLNNEMDDFSIKPGVKNAYGLTGGEANAIAPGKRPVSSMTPTIVLEGDRPVFAVSGAGGSRIITSVVQTTLNYLAVYPGDLRRSVFAPRIHHQWLPDKLDLEAGFSDGVRADLKARGHSVSEPEWDPVITAVGNDGHLTAVFDPREEGGVAAR